MFTYQTVRGVKCVELRIAEDNARDIWGTKVLPVISGDTELGVKLIREAHERMTDGYGTIHEGVTSTLAALQAGEKGVFIPYAKKTHSSLHDGLCCLQCLEVVDLYGQVERQIHKDNYQRHPFCRCEH